MEILWFNLSLQQSTMGLLTHRPALQGWGGGAQKWKTQGLGWEQMKNWNKIKILLLLLLMLLVIIDGKDDDEKRHKPQETQGMDKAVAQHPLPSPSQHTPPVYKLGRCSVIWNIPVAMLPPGFFHFSKVLE